MSEASVDFLPAAWRERRGRRRFWILRCLLLAAVLGAIGVHLLVSRGARDADQRRLAVTQQRYHLALGRIAEVEQLEHKKNELASRLAVLRGLLGRARGAEVFHAVGQACSLETTLHRVDMRLDESGTDPVMEVSLEGLCRDTIAVNELVRALEDHPLLEAATMVRTEKVDAYRDDKRFVITTRGVGLGIAAANEGAR